MPFCSKCGAVIHDDANFCNKCGANLVSQLQQTAGISPSTLETSTTPLRQNWFSRHLNWTYIIGISMFYISQFAIGLTYGFVRVASGNFYRFTQSEEDTLNFVAWLLSLLIIYIPITGWVLKKKGRSLWFLLISGFFFLPLWIQNKNALKPFRIKLSKIWKHTESDNEIIVYSDLEWIRIYCSLCSHFDQTQRFRIDRPWCDLITSPNIVQKLSGTFVCKNREQIIDNTPSFR